MSELNTVVILPIHRQRIRTVGLYSIKGELRINRYTPAVTMVAANSQCILGLNQRRALPCTNSKRMRVFVIYRTCYGYAIAIALILVY